MCKTPMSFEAWFEGRRLSTTHHLDMGEEFYPYQAAVVFDGNCYVVLDITNDEPMFHLTIGNITDTYSTLRDAALILYQEWYLPEVCGVES